MKLRKKVISTVLASSLILGSASFAADLTITNKNTGVATDFMDYVTNDDVFLDLATSTNSYLVEYNGKLYEAAKAVELTSDGKSMEEVIADGSLVEVEDAVGELKVESVSAITATGVTVKIAAPSKDLDGASIVVKDAAGKVIETIAADIKAGATEATFNFKTPLTVSPTSAWTVNGVAYTVEKFDIIAVESIDTKNKNLVVEFNSPVTSLEASEITIREKVSQIRSGVASVQLASDGMSAQITLVGDDTTGGLKAITLYTLSITKDGEVTSLDFQIPAIYENAVVKSVNTTARTITVAEKNTTTGNYGSNKTITVPEEVKFDFQEALGRDLTIWTDKDNKVTRFVYNDETVIYDAIEYVTKTIGGVSTTVVETVSNGETYEISTGGSIGVQTTNKGTLDQTIGNKDNYAKIVLGTDGKAKSIIAHDLNSAILVNKIEQETVSGNGLAASLKDYTIIKAGKTITISDIKSGDAIFYNTVTKVAEVYNNEVSGTISAFYDKEIQLEGKSYSIVNAQGVINDKFVNLTNDNVAAFTNVTAYLDRAGQLELLTGQRSEAASATSVAFAKEEISTFNYKGIDFIKLVTQKADGSQVTEEINAEELKVVEVPTAQAVSGNVRFQTANLTPKQTADGDVIQVSGFFIAKDAGTGNDKLWFANTGSTVASAKADVIAAGANTLATEILDLETPTLTVLEDVVDVTKADNVVTGINFLGAGAATTADAKLTDKALVTSGASYQLSSSTPVFIKDELTAGQIAAGKTQTYTSTTWGELDPNITKINKDSTAGNGEFTVYNDGKGNVKYIVLDERQIEGAEADVEFEGVVSEVKYGTQATPELAYIKFAGDDTKYTPTVTDTNQYVVGEVLNIEAKDSEITLITQETAGTTNKTGIYSATNDQIADGEFSIAGTPGYKLASTGAKVYEVTGTGVNEKLVERTYADLVNLKSNQFIEASLIAANSKIVDAIVIRTVGLPAAPSAVSVTSTLNAGNAAAAPLQFTAPAGSAVSITATDGTTTVTTSGTGTGSAQTVNVNVSTLADGPITFKLTSTTMGGTSSEASTTVTLDTTAPTATVSTSATNDANTFTVTPSETSTVAIASQSITTNTASVSGNVFSVDSTGATSGNTIEFTITDAAGNVSTYDATFTTTWAIVVQ